MTRAAAAWSLIVLAFGTSVTLAASVAIPPIKDSSLFENNSNNSSGQGACLYSGETGQLSRRLVMAFDVAGSIPAGATITDATLTLDIGNSGSFATATDTYTVHRLVADWGEDASDSGCGFPTGGRGVAAASGDATWSHRFIGSGMTWATPGGDFVAVPSGAAQLPTIGAASWSALAGMVADLQLWLDLPASNFGWIVIGNEATTRSARRFDSREGVTPPTLTIEFDPPAGPPPAVPDGVAGPPLLVEKLVPDASSLSVQFDTAVCSDNADHNLVFGGGSALPALPGGTYPLLGSDCTFGATSPSTWAAVADPAVVDPTTRFLWFLVLANDGGTLQGSWGQDGAGSERTGPGLNGSSGQCGIADKSLTNVCGNP